MFMYVEHNLPVKYAIEICYSDKNTLRLLFTQGIPNFWLVNECYNYFEEILKYFNILDFDCERLLHNSVVDFKKNHCPSVFSELD